LIVDEHAESFIVKDATGQALGYFYFEEEFGQRRSATNRLTKDVKAREIQNLRIPRKLKADQCASFFLLLPPPQCVARPLSAAVAIRK